MVSEYIRDTLFWPTLIDNKIAENGRELYYVDLRILITVPSITIILRMYLPDDADIPKSHILAIKAYRSWKSTRTQC